MTPKIAFVLLAVVVLSPSLAEAACPNATTGNADVYNVTVRMIEFSTDGTNFVTAFQGSTVIDIASVAAGSTAAGLVSGGAVPPGNYTNIRVTIGSTVGVRGFVNNGGTTVYTDGGTDAAAFTGVGGNNSPGTDCATSTFTVPANTRVSTDAVSFTVNPADGPPSSTVTISFDTSTVIATDGAGATLNEPVVTMTTS